MSGRTEGGGPRGNGGKAEARRWPLTGLLFALIALCVPSPSFAGDKAPEAFGEVSFETPEGGAYAQEMITMVVRFYFKARATTEQLEQPNLDQLGWTQLGRDTWAPTKIGSVNWFGFERRIAIFAPEAKTYTIPPFTHHVTLIDAQDVRWKVDAVSKPVTLTIRPWTAKTDGPEDKDTWWLPAQSVEVKDSWTIDPSTLAAGEVSRRRLDVTAVGTLAEQLPPTIDTQSPGLIVFPGPVERRTDIVDGVPIAHASYPYDIRPHTGDPTILREVLLPWFDTKARAMRQAIVPGANVGRGMVIPGQPTSDEAMADGGTSKLLAGMAAGLGAFVVGLAVLLAPGREDRVPFAARAQVVVLRLRRTLAVRRAALFGDAEGLRTAIYRLAREDGAFGRHWLEDAGIKASLSALDAALFGRTATAATGVSPGAGLLPVASAVLARRSVLQKESAADEASIQGPLSPFGR